MGRPLSAMVDGSFHARRWTESAAPNAVARCATKVNHCQAKRTPMTQETRFKAPWGDDVKVVTVLVTLFFLAASITCAVALPAPSPIWARTLGTFVPLLILAGTLFFIVRGYVVRGGELLI